MTGGIVNLAFGQYLPNDSAGNASFRNAGAVPPGNPFPFFDTPGADLVYPTGINSSERLTETETFSLGLNAAWDISDHTSLRFDYQRLQNDEMRVSSTYQLSSGGFYSPRPVAARGGEELRALSPTRSGFVPTLGLTARVEERESTTDILTMRGTSNFDQLELNYTLGYTKGTTETPFERSLAFSSSSTALGFDSDTMIDAAAIDPLEGFVVSPFAPLNAEDERLFAPRYTEAGFNTINNQNAFSRVRGSGVPNDGENERWAAELSARYDFDTDFLSYVDVGVDFERSDFQSFRLDGGSIRAGSEFTSLADLGVPYDTTLLRGLGEDLQIENYSAETAAQLIRSVDALVASNLITLADLESVPEGFGVRARETEIAPFFQARFDIGNFEIIGGGRYSIVEIEADDFESPNVFVNFVQDVEFSEANRVFVSQSATQEKFLPRIVANYRPSERIVVRSGYSKAIARPQLGLLSQTRSYSLSLRDGFDPFLSIREGNEDLEPAETDSYDLSFEYYTENAGVFKAAVFYKDINLVAE